MKKGLGVKLNGIGAKIGVPMVLLIFALAVILGSFSITHSSRLVANSLGKTALKTVLYTRDRIDPAKLRSIIESGDSKSYLYKEMRDSLNRIRESAGLLYLYTMYKDENNQYRYAVSGDPVNSEEASEVGEIEEEMSEDMIKSFDGAEVFGDLDYTEGYGWTISAYAPIKDPSGNIIGMVGADFDGSEAAALIEETKQLTIILTAVIILIGIIITYIITRYVSSPIELLSQNHKLIEEGKLNIRINTKRKDEFGYLMDSFDNMMKHLRDTVKSIRIASEELKSSSVNMALISEQSGKAAEELSVIINDNFDKSSLVNETIKEANVRIDNINDSAQSLAESSTQMQSVASGIESDAAKGSVYISAARDKIDKLGDFWTEAEYKYRELDNNSQSIDVIVKTIGSIAAQTNMLALNASIEAARAGEQGKGFAVVADEVRKLAEEASKSAKQIENMIKALQDGINEVISERNTEKEMLVATIEAVNMTAKEFASIMDKIKVSASMTADMEKSYKKQADEIQKLNEKLEQIYDMEEKNLRESEESTASVQEINAIIEELNAVADTLSQMAENLNDNVKKFEV